MFVGHPIYQLKPNSAVLESVRRATAGGKSIDWNGYLANNGAQSHCGTLGSNTRKFSDMTSLPHFHCYTYILCWVLRQDFPTKNQLY